MSKFNLTNLTSIKTRSPLKVVIYGDNGVGKSTFASEAEGCVFMDLEGNIDHLDSPKQSLKTWEECIEFLRSLITQEHQFKTLIIDSLEALEQKIWNYSCTANVTKDGYTPQFIDDQKVFSFGKGYSYALNIWRKFIEMLNTVRSRKGMDIILIAHSGVRKHEVFGGGSFDRYEFRLHTKAAGLIADWCHCIFFATTEVKIETDWKNLEFNKPKKKARLTGNRSMYTACQAAHLAKNVYNLPECLPLDWEIFLKYVNKFYENTEKSSQKETTESIPEWKTNLRKLIELKGYETEEAVNDLLKEYGTYWDEITETIAQDITQDMKDK